MNLSKKWLSTGLSTLFVMGLITGCSDDQKSPDLAVKDAYTNMWSGAYNYEGNTEFEVIADNNALIGTKGGLTEEEAKQELEIAEQFQSLQGQQILTMMQNAKFTFRGAFDGSEMKFDTIVGIDYSSNGVRMAFEIPMLLEFKNQITFYIDPKAARAFGMPPSPLDGKIIKLSPDDIPELTNEQKEKFKSSATFYKKFVQVTDEYMKEMDPKLFKNVDISDEAKKAGATRAVQLTFTPEESLKVSALMVDKMMNTFASDLNLTPEDIAKAKEQFQLSNQKTEMFIGDAVYIYGLNDKDQIVYMYSKQSAKGAKHIGSIKVTMIMKDFGKPTFTVDPSKQPIITLPELRAIDFNAAG